MLSEIPYIFNWWLLFFILGFVSLPLCSYLFKDFTDKGYAFAKITGLLIPSYIIFLFSIFKIFKLTDIFIYSVFIIFIFINLFIFQKNQKQIIQFYKKNIKNILITELLFSTGYLFWTIIRGYQPDINGLEKFMDFGFINSILRSQFLPPADMWAAGENINYYWFGHYLTAIATKLSGIPSHVTYNLMLATILGLCLTAALSIVSTLIHLLDKNTHIRKAIMVGLISAVMLAFAGNFHTPYYILKDGIDKYWYPDATRFIGYNPETDDKTIHEFPIYSFVVSDLHAHLINLPLVLLYIALLLRLLKKINEKEKLSVAEIVPNGFLIGVMFMTSAWDFANYSLLTGIALLLFFFNKYKFSLSTILHTANFIITYLFVSAVTILPFLLNFESIAEEVKFVNAHTPLWQLTILWGFPAILTAVFAWVFTKQREAKTSDLFVFALLITSWCLILLPEIIYVKDIYIASHHRANTMFKLTYQSFVMFYLSSGYIVYRVIQTFQKREAKIFSSLLFTIIFISLLIYPYLAIKSYYGELNIYHGISGETWMQRRYPGYYDTVQWFRDFVSDQPIILEAQGDSYTDYNMVSAYTGLPTINGWYVHEWLWRGSSDFPQKRANDIAEIYNSSSPEVAGRLLNNYDVEYVIVGPLEREKYTSINSEKFLNLGRQVFQSSDVKIFQIDR